MPPSRSSRYCRSRKTGLNVDLNSVPPIEGSDLLGTSIGGPSPGVAAASTALIDVEAFDDDVIISSPRAFAEAKNNSRRNNQHPAVVDVDSERQFSRHKRRRVSVNQTSINSGIYINLEASGNSAKENVSGVPQPTLPPKEPTFNCPVCMGPLVEEMSTKCGHIFCKECIKAAIAAQKKCPTCRRKVTPKDIIRVYLPATNCS